MVNKNENSLSEVLQNLQLDTQKSFVPQPNNQEEPIQKPTQDSSKKIQRNAFCPCGSSKKYKKCCGKISSSS